jgi:CDP-glucose 4,6-dehydratase
MTLMLKELGHEVSGLSLAPPGGGLFERANLESVLINHHISDIRNLPALLSAVREAEPDVLIHMAAQPLVIRSYEDPIETYTTNVDGTRNVLEVLSELENPPATLIVTTDKVYRDDCKGSYDERDPLGGHDPYSASKAMADILTQSWASTNPHLRLHIARAGNVIGAFDVSANRLLPDAMKAIKEGTPLDIRNPSSVRPWQHVLDCLAGYLEFVQHSLSDTDLPLALNFGPDESSIKTVSSVISLVKSNFPRLNAKESASVGAPKETQLLTLNSALARTALRWKNQLDFEEAVLWSLEELNGRDAREVAVTQIRNFLHRSTSA